MVCHTMFGRVVRRTGNPLSQVAEPACGVAVFQPKGSLVQALVVQRQLDDEVFAKHPA